MSSSTVDRRFARCAGLRVHYREAGLPGQPLLVLLHPSPRSSAMYEPWMPRLAQHFHVLAPDTPGYGASDALPQPARHLSDYLPVLRAWREQVAGSRPMLVYGSATGGQIGIAWANAAPQDMVHLAVDNAAHYGPQEMQWMLQNYFPDFTPQPGGAHLREAWRMAEQMLQFFPWFAADEAHRIGAPGTADQVHAVLMDVLATGPRWAEAYRCAIAHENVEPVRSLRVPTTLLRWQGSMLLQHIDELIAYELPAHVQVLTTPAEPAARINANTAHLVELRKKLLP